MIQRYGAFQYVSSVFINFCVFFCAKIFDLCVNTSYLCGMKNIKQTETSANGKNYSVSICKLYRKRGGAALKNLTLRFLPEDSSCGRHSFELRDGVRVIVNERQYSLHLIPKARPFWGETPLEAAQKAAEHYAKETLAKRKEAAKYATNRRRIQNEIDESYRKKPGLHGILCK